MHGKIQKAKFTEEMEGVHSRGKAKALVWVIVVLTHGTKRTWQCFLIYYYDNPLITSDFS